MRSWQAQMTIGEQGKGPENWWWVWTDVLEQVRMGSCNPMQASANREWNGGCSDSSKCKQGLEWGISTSEWGSNSRATAARVMAVATATMTAWLHVKGTYEIAHANSPLKVYVLTDMLKDQGVLNFMHAVHNASTSLRNTVLKWCDSFIYFTWG